MRDEALEAAFARGEAAAFDAAYRMYGARLRSSAHRVLQDRQAAQDCIHDVLLHLWKRGDAYAPVRGSLEAFLTVCVRNEALSRVRKRVRHEAIHMRLPKGERYTMDSDPIERERIARAVASLTPLQFAVIDRAYFKAMTLAEIAHDLHKPLGTVKSHVSAALRALRARLLVDASPND